ncbi:MAG: VacB/RNase II family 3'-5' exoribonuclease, partial [Oscillospiraceae bacterium]|nr:VacB/RNase II family 3'-5' exoribonuclease [Oscillospiraceae bacterium]
GDITEVTPGPRRYVGVHGGDSDGLPVIRADSGFKFRLPLGENGKGAAKPGDKVGFTVSHSGRGEWPDLQASIDIIYGDSGSARVCTDAIIAGSGIPATFNEEALREAERSAARPVTAEEIALREDLRDRLILTIDGEDARDLDDAISLWEQDGRQVLGVHIADVSRYVAFNSVLEQEARERGTSLYFADRVIPMLPPALSNGVCSLNPGEDKLTFSAFLTYDGDGQCVDFRLAKTVIRTALRGIYSELNMLFAGQPDEPLRHKYQPAAEMLEKMRKLADSLRQQAAARYTLEVNSRETGFVIDAEGRPVEILPRFPGEAEELIEMFMIAANQQAAALAKREQLPFVYRVHDQPDPGRVAALLESAAALGYLPKQKTEVSLRLFRELSGLVKDTPHERMFGDAMLRSMAKARYAPLPLGHFGLALEDYCHFTSPIRRFPDLAIHRILSDWVEKKTEMSGRYDEFVSDAARQSSLCELRAMKLERDCSDCYKAEYIRDHLGEVFDGVISSVVFFGIYVELPNTVEGLIRTDNLPGGPLSFDSVASFRDRQGTVKYATGDSITIRVESADVSNGQIDFSVVTG